MEIDITTPIFYVEFEGISESQLNNKLDASVFNSYTGTTTGSTAPTTFLKLD